MLNPVRIATSDEGRLLVDLDDFVDAIIFDLRDIPDDGVLRPSEVIDSLRQYKFLVHKMAEE